MLISIHALTRRATYRQSHSKPHPQISIHALTRRATRLSAVGCRLDHISIHALTRRATNRLYANSTNRINFNSHSHEESDVFTLRLLSSASNFNSHSHEESDQSGLSFPPFPALFQFTLSRGERQISGLDGDMSDIISIHTLTRRATVYFKYIFS